MAELVRRAGTQRERLAADLTHYSCKSKKSIVFSIICSTIYLPSEGEGRRNLLAAWVKATDNIPFAEALATAWAMQNRASFFISDGKFGSLEGILQNSGHQSTNLSGTEQR
jgi:hypothetical protein